MTAQPQDLHPTPERAEAVRKYFTKTPAGPSYALALTLGANAIVFALITIWIVVATVRQQQAAQTQVPSPAPQPVVEQKKPAAPEPQARRGKRRRRQTQESQTTTTATETTTTSTAAPPAQAPQQQQALNCASCASLSTGTIAVLSGILAAAAYIRRRRVYVRDWNNAEPKPSDAQIDAWHQADRKWLEQHALLRLHLERVQVMADKGPLMVVGPGPAPQFRRGQDGRIRFSSHEVLIIYLTDYHLAAYKCVIDLHNRGIQTETTQEYHFADVVSVSTQTDNSPLIWYEDGQAQHIPTHQRFAMSVASGEQISVAVAAQSVGGRLDEELVRVEKNIQTLRRYLRDKKGGAQDTSDHGRLI